MPRRSHHQGAQLVAGMDGRGRARAPMGRRTAGAMRRPPFGGDATVEEDTSLMDERDGDEVSSLLDENDMVDVDDADFIERDNAGGAALLGDNTELGDDDDDGQDGVELDDAGEEGGDEDEEEQFYEDEEDYDCPPIAPNLREISSLASWQLSSHKPGCGISALRSSSYAEYWQSDGPQPHTLTLHFFKRVEIVRLRVFLDFTLDESYTPTKMEFYAGMGGNDLVEFATWQGANPRGWVNINLEGVGGKHEKMPRHKKRTTRPDRGEEAADDPTQRKRKRKSTHAEDEAGGSNADKNGMVDGGNSSDDPDHMDISDSSSDYDSTTDELDSTTGNVLKAMVLQMRIIENHQNGKDSHVRGFQVFARDDRRGARAEEDDPKAKGVESGKQQEDDDENDVKGGRSKTSFIGRYRMPEPEIR